MARLLSTALRLTEYTGVYGVNIPSPRTGGLEELGELRKEFAASKGPRRAERAGASESLGQDVGLPSPHDPSPAGRERGFAFNFPGDDAAASKACSDHRPIWIRVRVPATDDD